MNPTLYSIYLVILFIALLASILNRKEYSQYSYLFILLLAVTFVVETTSFFLLLYTRQSTQIFYHFFLPFSYSVHALIYAKAFDEKRLSRFLVYSIPVFLVVHLVLSLTIQPVNKPNSYAFLLAAGLIVSFSLTYLLQLLREPVPGPIQLIPMFWISTGNLFFYSGAFILMGLLNYLLGTNKPLASKLFTINYLLNYILYSLYCIGFLCRKKWRTPS